MDPKDSVADINSTVKLEAIKHLIKLQFKDPKTRIGDDTIRLVGEVVQLLIVETAARSCNQALLAGFTVVEMEHVEKVLPKLATIGLLRIFLLVFTAVAVSVTVLWMKGGGCFGRIG